MKKIDCREIEKKLGYKFKNRNFLYNALTHSSYNNENNIECNFNNERLEFLGDATLELIISEYLYKKFPDLTEGEMTKMRARIVCTDALAQSAFNLELGNMIIMGKGEIMSGGRTRKSIMANTMEAIIGAIYLDGGFNCARDFVLNKLYEIIIDVEKGKINKDYKSILQELVQREKYGYLEYQLIKEEGPDHDKKFYVNVIIDNKVIGFGVGKNKKEAEQRAAKEAIDLLNKKDEI
ncbi:ribonuclease III [Garciella nitratireducens]|uniref:ribonuclease III n=1 Tax=Garciella nitratireducens TaxID=218205 RepID=UPI000DEA6052|nr:ribonuclease III [Garciella nitratireducens]RBP41134.1 RNAse III [Garciella nitratireducens]